ncbi:MAG: hypothetical protein ACYDFU_06800 [Nitrospirota bacterium]
MKRHLLAVAAATVIFSATTALAGVSIYITPPPIPLPVPPVPVVVFPPPPPDVVITPGPPSYWFWDGRRSEWFYYDRYRHPHFVRGHVFRDDGRHFYMSHGRWARARHDMGRHRGWYKHERREDRREHGRGHGHGRWGRDRD